MHILKDIIDVNKSDSLAKVIDMQGVKSMTDLFIMTEEDILALEYDDNGVKTPIKRTKMYLIRLIQTWNIHLNYFHVMQINWMD